MSSEPTAVRALLVEDSEDDAFLLIEVLRRGGYEPDWERVETEESFRAALARRKWDVVFCDYSMRKFNALSALRILRENGDTLPAIIVSGKAGEYVAVEAMRLGANDFVLKHNLARLPLVIKRELQAEELRRERRSAGESLRQAHEVQDSLFDALQESERRFRGTFEQAAIGMANVSTSGQFLEVNEKLCEIVGYKREELQGMTFSEITIPEERGTGEAALAAMLQGSLPNYTVEKRYVRKDGAMIWVSLAATLQRTEAGEPAYLIAAMQDITARKLAEEALRSSEQEQQLAREALRLSEERFRQMAENSGEVFWLTDAAKMEVLYVSPAYEKVWGRTCESLLAAPTTTSILDTIHPDDQKRVDKAFLLPMESNVDVTYRIVRQDGTLRWIHHRAYPVRDGTGKIYRLAGIAADITEATEADAKIREQAALLDHARDAILVQDMEGYITYWNKGAERSFGWTAEEARGKRAQDLLYDDPAPYRTAMEAALQRGGWRGEMTKRTKAGAHVIVEGRWNLVQDLEGAPKSILAINTDITEKRKMEAQFFRAQRMESIGTLAGGIAHDLNNVLGPIIMAVDLLNLTVTDPRDRDLLELMETSARRGADMVKQVLFFARGIEGQRALIPPALLVKELQQIARDTFSKSISVEGDVPAETWSTQVDRTQIHQVLLNLCVNARDAMPHGGYLRISARNRTIDAQFAAMHPEAYPGPYVVFEVRDTGEGMTPEVMKRIFEPFFTTKEIGKGTGLGLSTTHAIVKGHGGFVTVRSEPGQGTTFEVNLPAESGSGETQPETTAQELPRGNGEIILIIDDEAAIRSITGQTLEAFGYRILTAGDGAEGVATYAQHMNEIAAVLTDMMMPVMDGVSTIRVLRRLKPTVKIIAASGLTSKAVEEQAEAAGVDCFLPKPYAAEALLRALNSLLHPEA